VEYYAAVYDREASMFGNVVVGVGGHEGWRDAVALAKRLLSGDGRLTLANIFVFASEPHLSSGYSRDVEAMERERAAELLQEARAQAGIPAGARWRGAASVGRGLHELAERLAADLLVVGTSRQGLLRRALIGDNTRAALSGAPCAVAVAPAGYARHACEIRRVRVLGERSAGQFVPDDGSADLLVVASRGSGPLGRIVDRGTYPKLVRNAQCPLLVLRPGASPLAAAEALMYGESPVAARPR
jgi:nucleotide-binding universal stress UspA family protein